MKLTRKRDWIIILGICLYAVPWYWSDDSVGLWSGLPTWLWTTISGSAMISAYAAYILLRDNAAGGERD